jgi:hypothetical protein
LTGRVGQERRRPPPRGDLEGDQRGKHGGGYQDAGGECRGEHVVGDDGSE